MNPNCEQRENIYFSIIKDCEREINEISANVSMISSPSLVKSGPTEEIPVRTELEGRLMSLRAMLKTLKNDLVI
jgi:hypothetical protein